MTVATQAGFKARADAALADATLKLAIDRTTGTAETQARRRAVAAFPEFEAARARGKAIKDHVIAHLDHYLETFERNAIASGAQVHWASSAEEATAIVVRICKEAGARSVTRAKSMLGEEIGLPHALADAGIERVETDLAEHIIQLAGETPSHIIWPAMHRTREQVAVLFNAAHQPPPAAEDPASMVQSARRVLREKFLSADVGISGRELPRRRHRRDLHRHQRGQRRADHHAAARPYRDRRASRSWCRARRMPSRCCACWSAPRPGANSPSTPPSTAARSGPATPTGRRRCTSSSSTTAAARMLADEFREMLRCIRCGACMNHCVVYRQIGGHAYGGVYPGPMGAVLTPVLDGLAASRDLPFACTMNGRCAEVCPVQIPLPTLLRAWRVRSWHEGLEKGPVRAGLGLWAAVARRPGLYRLASGAGVRALRLLGKAGWIRSLPLAGGWTKHRDLPAPAGGTFMQRYKAERAKGDRR